MYEMATVGVIQVHWLKLHSDKHVHMSFCLSKKPKVELAGKL